MCSQRNRPLGSGVVAKMLELVKKEFEEQDDWVAREYCKFGAAVALAVCGSLQGPEVFLLDLARLWMYIEMGRSGTVPTARPVEGRNRPLQGPLRHCHIDR